MNVRRIVSLALAAAVVALVAVPAFAAEQSWTGKISDSMCGAKHHAGEHDKKLSEADCTKACVKGGAKYVLMHEGKMTPIANQDFAGLEEHAGQMVKVSGEMSGDAIKVSKIEPAPAKKAKKAAKAA